MDKEKIFFKFCKFAQFFKYFLTFTLFSTISVSSIFALESGNVIDSSGVIGATWGDNTVLNTNHGAIINWNNFNTTSAQSITFNQYMNGQLSRMSAVLNRISSGAVPTQFNGALNANGRVFIVNPAGVIFGGGATINVNQLIASSLNITNSNFLSGHYEFLAGSDNAGAIINNGSITASDGVALIGNRVLNTGAIKTDPGGFVVMAAGDKVVLNESRSNVIVEMDSVELPDGINEDGAGDIINESTGQISAPGGTIVLAAGDIFSTALNLDSKAAKVESGIGRIEQNGIINADSIDSDAGNINISAADEVVLASESYTTANAGVNGNGGEVILYSEGTTVVDKGAVVEAIGGAESGDGGFVEVSGEHFILAGDVDASATNGAPGTLLIDPEDVTIADGGGIDDPENIFYEENIESISQAGTNVAIQADNSITVENISDNEITGGTGSISLLTSKAESFIKFLDKDDAITTTLGDIVIETGGGGAEIGSLITAKDLTNGNVTPGQITVTTTDGGGITAENLSIETGWGHSEIYVDASGNLEINGNVTVGKQMDPIVNVSNGPSADAIVNLNAEGNIILNGEIGVYAGTQYCFKSCDDTLASILCYESCDDTQASILINAGDYDIPGGQVWINGNLTAQANAGKYGKSRAYILVHAIGPENDNIIFDENAEAPRADADDAHVQSYESALDIVCSDVARIKIISEKTEYEPPLPPTPPPGPPDDDDDDDTDIQTYTLLAVPIPEDPEIEFSGCPALLKWAADEIGIDESKLQVWMSYDLTSSRDTQPCESCAKLKQAAAILQDAEGTHIAALAQVINEFASSTAPPSGESMALIANAIASNLDAGSHYAMSGRYLDALTEYVGILNNEMNLSREESIMFAADNYILPMDGVENGIVADFLSSRLAALGG